MRRVEFRINGVTLDTYEISKSPIVFRRRAEVLDDLTKRDGDTTIEFALPKTQTNAQFFGNLSDLQAAQKFYTAYPFSVDLVSGGIYIIRNGRLTVQSITKSEYKCRIVATNINWANAFREKTLRDILSFRKLPYTGLDTVIEVTDAQALAFAQPVYTHCDNYDVCFPLVFCAPPFVPNQWNGTTYISRKQYSDAVRPLPAGKEIFGFDSYRTDVFGNAHFNFQDYKPAVYLRSIIRALFKDIGYEVTGSILDDNEFRKLALLFTGERNMFWNWATMGAIEITNDGSQTLGWNGLTVDVVPPPSFNLFNPTFSEPYDASYEYVLYSLSTNFEFEIVSLAPSVLVTDLGQNVLPKTQFYPSFTYFAPADGLYRFRIQFDGEITFAGFDHDIYIVATRVLKDVNDTTSDDFAPGFITDISSPPSIDFDPTRVSVIGVIDKSLGVFSFDSFADIQLSQNELVNVGLIMLVPLPAPVDPFTRFIDNVTPLTYTVDFLRPIDFVEGQQYVDLDPAQALQKIKQSEFIKDLNVLFNLFYDVDEANKTVYIDTYNRFFENIDTALDLTEFVNLDSFESKPPPQFKEYNFVYSDDEDALVQLRGTTEKTRNQISNVNQYGTGGVFFQPDKFGATEFDSFAIVDDTANNFVNPVWEIRQVLRLPYITTKENYGAFQNDNVQNEYDWLMKLVKMKSVMQLDPSATIPFLINGALTFYDKVPICVFDDTDTPPANSLLWSLSWKSDYGLVKLLWLKRLFDVFTSEIIEFETNIRALEYSQMTYRKLLKIENQVYRLAEVQDFDPIELGTTKITLIKT